jgi:hypothetical protein
MTSVLKIATVLLGFLFVTLPKSVQRKPKSARDEN